MEERGRGGGMRFARQPVSPANWPAVLALLGPAIEKEGAQPDEIYGNLTEMNRDDIMDALGRQERSSQYGGQRYVSAPRILTCNPITTVMVQSGGLDI